MKQATPATAADASLDSMEGSAGGGDISVGSSSSIKSRLGDRLRSLTTEPAPTLSAQGIYQIKSSDQHR